MQVSNLYPIYHAKNYTNANINQEIEDIAQAIKTDLMYFARLELCTKKLISELVVFAFIPQ